MVAMLATTGCRKTSTKTLEEEMPEGTPVMMGSFVSNDHPTSGTAKVFSGSSGRTLALQNFRTDAGPDLKIWLATSTSASNYIALGELKSTNGNFNYSIPASADLTRYNKVLVWCEDFSVLFGHAVLQ